jgi:hypothetical protein
MERVYARRLVSASVWARSVGSGKEAAIGAHRRSPSLEDVMFIQTVSEAEAEGKVREVYDGDQEAFGYVPNHAKVFSLRPDALTAWRGLQGSIRKNLRLRRYELVTLAAAKTV